MVKLDFSMIRNVRVPHKQFEAIKNKAKYLIVEDRENGEVPSRSSSLFCSFSISYQ